MLHESDARTCVSSDRRFRRIGPDGADKIIKSAKIRPRVSPGKLLPKEFGALLESLRTLNLNEGQTMTVYRFANRVPLQFQPGACLITQSVCQMNWRTYGLSQTRGQLLAAADDYRSPGQCLGTLHQRIERGDRRLPGNPERASSGTSSGWTKTRHVPETTPTC